MVTPANTDMNDPPHYCPKTTSSSSGNDDVLTATLGCLEGFLGGLRMPPRTPPKRPPGFAGFDGLLGLPWCPWKAQRPVPGAGVEQAW